VAAGKIAIEVGFENVRLIAVEASSNPQIKINDHLSRNGLAGRPNVEVEVINKAVYTDRRILFFPNVELSKDNGAQVTDSVEDSDYRGLKVDYAEVEAIPLRDICINTPYVDFLHMDLQGCEELLFQDDDFLSILDSKVATLYLATQTRMAEGVALRVLSKLNWTLLRERPTDYIQNERTNKVEGWTLRDGGQLWINRKLVSE
jgi:FkbM family methyltransferase